MGLVQKETYRPLSPNGIPRARPEHSYCISLDQPDYLNCTCLIEGGILFLASKVFEVTLPLHPICQRRLDISPILVDDLSGELAHADLI